MEELIKKYEAKLEYLNDNLEKTRHLMDEDLHEIMQDVGNLLKEVISDLKTNKMGKERIINLLDNTIKDYEGRVTNIKIHLTSYNEREETIRLTSEKCCYNEFLTKLKRIKNIVKDKIEKSTLK